jgi:hypothetical protein
MNNEASLQVLYEPKYIPAKEIEDDALHLIRQYKPNYLTDLNAGLDYYEFIFDFLPDYLKRKKNEFLTVDFYGNTIKSDDNSIIAAFTEADKVSIDRTYFDSDNIIDNYICNFTIAHEAYHVIKHRIYLKASENQLNLFGATHPACPKLKKLITLQRDLSGRASNKFCLQANMFASFFTMPRERVRMALLENMGTDAIEIEGNDDRLKEAKTIVRSHIAQHFDINTTPLAIAVKTYGFVREKNPTLSMFR